jgi:ketosteroid isomerase-like protein
VADHVRTVQSLYEAFARGDVATILAALSPDVVWSNAGPDDLEYFGTRHGRDGALEVFTILGRDFEIAEFAPQRFFGDGDQVVVTVHQKATVKATGRSFEQDLVHVWTFGADGLVTRFLDVQDSAGVAAALRP